MSLVKTNHFTRTAELLHMTQPGVSQHIQKLEAQIGKALLNRHGKSFELTAAGDSLYQYGIQQAQAESELLNTIAEDDRYAGECRLACSGSMAMQLYPELLRLQQRFANLSMSIEAAPNAAIFERVKTNQSDMGLVTQPITDPKLEQTLLGEDELCLVVPNGSKSSWESLMELGFINHPDGYHYGIQQLEANFPNEFRGMESIPQSGYINQLSQILLPVSQRLGFTVLPKSSVEAFPFPDKISIVELAVPVNEPVYLITKKHRSLPKRYQLIKDSLAEQWGDGKRIGCDNGLRKRSATSL
ncbi:MAG: LysR family transcriptional regulator [Motiliproteus sp.]|nr:LysR family transcriptional regulator [Motiliproteus sp.]